MDSMIKHTFSNLFKALLIICMLTSIAGSIWLPVYAQTDTGEWSTPENLSKSGYTSDSILTTDSSGVTHVFWIDRRSGFFYSHSEPSGWSKPIPVAFPVSIGILTSDNVTQDDFPRLISGPRNQVYLFWQEDNLLRFNSGNTSNGRTLVNWVNSAVIARSAVDYDVVVDLDGVIHVAYVQAEDSAGYSPGVYYLRSKDGGGSWSLPILLYTSPYYRSLVPLNEREIGPENSVDLAVTSVDDEKVVYAAFDNQPRKRVMFTQSLDGGTKWGEAIEIDAPSVSAGISSPGDIHVSAKEENVLLTWQVKQSETVCFTFFRSSSDRGSTWSVNQRLGTPYIGCPEKMDFINESAPYTLMVSQLTNQTYLVAWNGKEWSKFQSQNSLTTFSDPGTLLEVEYYPTDFALAGSDKLGVVGYDRGSGGDTWVTFRPLSDMSGWFTEQPGWQVIESIWNTSNPIRGLNMVADTNGRFHAVWSQIENSSSESTDYDSVDATHSVIYYAFWDETKWSTPVVIQRETNDSLTQPMLILDRDERFVLSWKESSSGVLYFSWALANQAGSELEWAVPKKLPIEEGITSPSTMVVTPAGKLAFAYSISINEKRGVYLLTSSDLGKTWDPPKQILDGAETGLRVVGGPQLEMLPDGSMHLLVGDSSLEETSQYDQVYYLRSADYGLTWSEAELISEYPIFRYRLIASDTHTLHRVVQESNSNLNTIKEQISVDGGVSWSREIRIAESTGPLWFGDLKADAAGQLHLVYTTLDSNNYLTVYYLRWNGVNWNIEDSYTTYQAVENIHQETVMALNNLEKLGVINLRLGLDPVTQTPSYFLTFTSRNVIMPEIAITPSPPMPVSSVTPVPTTLLTSTLLVTATIDPLTLEGPQTQGSMSSILLVSVGCTVVAIGLGLLIYFLKVKKP